MIIFEDKGFQTRSDKPDSDWTGKAKYIVPDGTELANKIISLYPWYDFVIDENGVLIDVVEVEHEVVEPEFPITETEKLRADVDFLLVMGGYDE